jgi:glycerate dehydrogenase
LVEGHLAGVALDVQDPEPPAPKDLLWSLENVILTHHQGWKTFEARTRLVARVAEQIRGFLHSPDSSST